MPSLKSCSQVSWVKRHQVSAQFNFKNTALLVVVIQITPNQSSLQLLSSVEPHWIFPWLISRREKLSLQDLGWLCDTIDWCEYYWIYTQPSHFQIIHVDHQFQISSLNSGIPLAIVRAFLYCVNQPNNPRECPGPELSTTRVRLTDECESTCSSQGPCVPPSCISEPRFEQFLVQMDASSKETWQRLDISTPSLESPGSLYLGHACLRSQIGRIQTQLSHVSAAYNERSRHHNSRTTLFQHWCPEQRTLKIFVPQCRDA